MTDISRSLGLIIGIVAIIIGSGIFYTYTNSFTDCSKYRLTVETVSTDEVQNETIENFSELSNSQKELMRTGSNKSYVEVSEETYNEWEDQTYVRYSGDIYTVIPSVGHCSGNDLFSRIFQGVGVVMALSGLGLIVLSRWRVALR